MRRAAAAMAALLLLAACGQRGATDVGGVTPDEARQLNDAAAMLDANAVEANVVIANNEDDD